MRVIIAEWMLVKGQGIKGFGGKRYCTGRKLSGKYRSKFNVFLCIGEQLEEEVQH